MIDKIGHHAILKVGTFTINFISMEKQEKIGQLHDILSKYEYWTGSGACDVRKVGLSNVATDCSHCGDSCHGDGECGGDGD